MKTKYIKVAVSDRLPKKGGTKDSDIGLVFYNEKLKLFEDNDMPAVVYPEYFFEEFPDHEAELVEKTYQIDFNGNVLTSIKVVDNKIEILGAMNGYGNGINVSDIIIIEEIPNPKSKE